MSHATIKTYHRLLRRILTEISQAPIGTSDIRKKLLEKKLKKLTAKIEELKK